MTTPSRLVVLALLLICCGKFTAAQRVGSRTANTTDVRFGAYIKQRVLRSGIESRTETTVSFQGEHYFDLTVEPLRDALGDVVGVTCAAGGSMIRVSATLRLSCA
jgi:hypothetical protein